MVARRDLHPDPAKRLGRLLAQTRAEAAKNSTGPAGVKHLGAEGDVVWDVPVAPGAGERRSLRALPAELEEAQARIEEAEESLALARTRLGEMDDELTSAFDAAAAANGKASQAVLDARDAWNKAILAEGAAGTARAAADLNYQKVLSRGSNLVTNGSGYLGDNTNFSSLTADKGIAPDGVVTAFRNSTFSSRTVGTDELIPFELNTLHEFSFQIRETVEGKSSAFYSYIEPYDAYGQAMKPEHYMFQANTTTTLLEEVKPGDTIIKLANPTNWRGTEGHNAGNATHLRSIIFWGYVDPGGVRWEPHTYSRYRHGPEAWADGGIAADGTITLTKPVPSGFPVMPAGTPVSNNSSGGALIYRDRNERISEADGWKKFSGVIELTEAPVAAAEDGRSAAQFVNGKGWAPPGMSQVRVGWRLNYTGSGAGSQQAVCEISVGEVGAALEAAQAAQTAAAAARAKADQAKTDAATAAGVAGGKADVLIQSTAPAAAMQKATTLWIDTTGGLNAPKRWNGSAWMTVTDKAATDAAQAAAAAQATANQATTDAATAKAAADAAKQAADAAQATADSAQTAATRAMTAANGKNAIITSTGDATGTTNPETGAPLVIGDEWNKVNSMAGLHLIAKWRWSGTDWVPTMITDTMIDNVSAHKLVVTGSSHFNQAFINMLMADVAYFKEANTESTFTQYLAAQISDLINARIENLIVTEGATINAAVILKLATQLIESKMFKTDTNPVTGLTAIMDSNGFRVFRADPDGDVNVINLGVDGADYLQIGEGQQQVTIDSAGVVSAQSVNAQELNLRGEPLTSKVQVLENPIVAYAALREGQRSVERGPLGPFLDIGQDLEVGYVYEIRTTPGMVFSPETGTPALSLHATIDGNYPASNASSQVTADSNMGPYQGWRMHAPLSAIIDLRTATATNAVKNTLWYRAFAAIRSWTSGKTAYLEAVTAPYEIIIERKGAELPDTGRAWLWSAPEDPPPPPPPPARVTRTLRYPATGYTVFNNGAPTSGEPRQGDPQTGRQYQTAWVFDSWRERLQQAGVVVRKVTLAAWADYWWFNTGGVGVWQAHTHFGSLPQSVPGWTYLADSNPLTSNFWPRGAMRTLVRTDPSSINWWVTQGRGFGFSSNAKSGPKDPRYYGKFSTIVGSASPQFVEFEIEEDG